MKSLVYETPVNSAEELVARISAAAGDIRNTPEMLSNVRRSMKRRGGHQTCLSINRLWHELCDMLCRLVGTTAPGHHDCSIQE
ncbi:hypothetical protein TNCV_2712721 [Trichonephila clavipes]|uniref:Uncharacterized protein n=1 Tax=Trichonephila clavipes TaxID=2585209 RepID=A0A8X6URY8_TRICX|nr:hypothetical protein TNCV_2712721 [Trichonephila clavipes]